MFKKLVNLVPFLCFIAFPCAIAQGSTEQVTSFSLYLVRHAEKQTGKNPELTECGQQRAQLLADYLKNKNVAQVYSTATKRTEMTAKPSAEQTDKPIHHYSHKALAAFAEQLLASRQNALVVGHSNTTPQLAGFLTNQTMTSLSEKDYDKLYIVNVSIDTLGEYQVKLAIKQQHFTCNQ